MGVECACKMGLMACVPGLHLTKCMHVNGPVLQGTSKVARQHFCTTELQRCVSAHGLYGEERKHRSRQVLAQSL